MIANILAFVSGAIIALGGWLGLGPEEVTAPAIPEVEAPSECIECPIETFGEFTPAAGGTYRLRSSIGTTNTSITLSSFTEPISGTPITMSNLNSDIGYATIDPQSSSRKEFISFTGITQNADGTATLTGVSRGLGFLYPHTASTTLRKSHPGQSILILSDSPQLFNEYARRRSDETITGLWTIPTPTSASNPATKAYVDSVVNGGAVTLDGISVAGTAGETFATGTIVYYDETATEWLKADASATSTSAGVLLGIAQGPGSNGVSINGGVLIRGHDETNVGGTPGDTLYLSDTAGATSTSAGTVKVKLGQVRSATSFYFAPGDYVLPTFDQWEAMRGGGDFKTASTTNRFITERGLSSAMEDVYDAVTFPTISATSTADAANSSSVSLSAPAGTTAGDLIVVFMNSVNISSGPSGYTLISSTDDSVAYAKIATESDTFTATLSGATDGWAAVAFRITNVWGATAVSDIVLGTATSSTATPILNPENRNTYYLWMTSEGWTNTGNITAAPSGYTNFVTVESDDGDSGEHGIAVASKPLRAIDENPGEFTESGTVSNSEFMTIAIKGLESYLVY